MARRVRVIHVINSFEFGGAEAMLCNLLLRADRAQFDLSVVALINDMTVAGPILRAGIPVAVIGMRPGVPDPRGVWQLARHLARARPDVIQTWMDHSNLIGGIAARLGTRSARLVWGVHHSDHVRGVAKRSTLMTVAACAALSKWVPDQVVCCSEHAAALYARRGFAADRLTVIPNGFDTAMFRPDPEARAAVRQELCIGANVPLVGLAARYDPMKDHANFLRAAALLAARQPDVRFLLCGANIDARNAALVGQVDALGLGGRCHLLGPRRDIARVYAALDVLASSSISEAFPLALGEAMACGVPCAATNVGDSALILGPTGRIVPPRNPAALANAWAELLAMPPDERTALGTAARERVCQRFDLGAVTRRYEQLYLDLANADRQSTRGASTTTTAATCAVAEGSVASAC